MSSSCGTGMIHIMLCRKAFVKVNWASKLGLSGRDWEVRHWGRHPGVLMHGWAWPEEMHLTCYGLEFAVVLGMDMVCGGGIRSLAGCAKGSGFSTVTHFPSGWPKRGSVMRSIPLAIKKWQGIKRPSPEIWRSENLNHVWWPKHMTSPTAHSCKWGFFGLVSNEVFDTFSKCRKFQALVSHSACWSRSWVWLETSWWGWVSLAVLTRSRSCKVRVAPAWLVWYKLFGLDMHNTSIS